MSLRTLRNMLRYCALINLKEHSSYLVRIIKQSIWKETEVPSFSLPGPGSRSYRLRQDDTDGNVCTDILTNLGRVAKVG